MVGWSHDDSVVTGQHREALQYNGMIDAFRKTVRHEGVGALYKGLVLNSVKVILFNRTFTGFSCCQMLVYKLL
jgi:solute carrier family 25 (mitochondrial phosphate transporter), member 23/24/25/41